MTGHVLLAEDVSANIALYKAILTKSGFHVDVAPDGEMAVSLATRAGARHDVILMDLGLPKLDGLGAAKAIRAAGVATPILALTAEDDLKTRRACTEVGMNGFLTKPLSPVTLVKTLRELAIAPA